MLDSKTMSLTAAQLEANRLNAQFSTGPRTEEGKRASSQNAASHGLSGKQIVMPGESAEAYEVLRSGLIDCYNPNDEAELILVI
jgi:hypothetical protein